MTREEAERVGRIAKALLAGALANKDVQRHLRDLTARPRYTLDVLKACLPVRLEWEYVTVVGPIGDCFFASRNKRFGELEGVLPLEPDTPVDRERVLFIYKEASPYNRRVEQRKHLKKKLGAAYRKLVNLAQRNTKGRFLKLAEDPKLGCPGSTARVRAALRMDLGRFWRVAKGKEWIEIPKKLVQRELDFGD